jgi:hypothetical protein
MPGKQSKTVSKKQSKEAAKEAAANLMWEQIGAWRMERQFLVKRQPAAKLVEVTSRLAGLHAQLMSSAELTLWARCDGFTKEKLAKALWQDRQLVKIWAMRGTLHVLPAAEYAFWQSALNGYKHYLKPAWFRYFGVTESELGDIMAAVGNALDGKTLTRQELAEAVVGITKSEHLGEKLRESWGALLKPASFQGQLCFADSVGQNVRFTNPHSWLKIEPMPASEENLAQAMLRYLAAYGPATRDDCARWWATTPAHVSKLLAGLGDTVIPVEVDGTPGWWLRAEDLPQIQKATPQETVRLLPAFDQYVIGVTGHAASVIPGDFKARIYRPQGWVSPVLVVDGQMAGVWSHELKSGTLSVQIEPFIGLSGAVRKATEAEAERLAKYLGGDLRVSWG